jgi:CRP-like cAMP-binding protein
LKEDALQQVGSASGGWHLIRTLESITTLTTEEHQAVLDLPMTFRSYEEGRDILRAGDRPDECCLILDGFTCRYKLLPDGGGRSWPSTRPATCRTSRACTSA